MMLAMSIDCMATQMQIGLEVSQIGISNQLYALRSAMSSWFSKKQSSVSLSTTEAKYIVACSASCESVWL